MSLSALAVSNDIRALSHMPKTAWPLCAFSPPQDHSFKSFYAPPSSHDQPKSSPSLWVQHKSMHCKHKQALSCSDSCAVINVEQEVTSFFVSTLISVATCCLTAAPLACGVRDDVYSQVLSSPGSDNPLNQTGWSPDSACWICVPVCVSRLWLKWMSFWSFGLQLLFFQSLEACLWMSERENGRR